MLKIQAVSYINTYPLIGAWLQKKLPLPSCFELAVDTPTNNNAALRQKKCDLALISSISYLQNFQNYLLYPAGIAAKKQSMSVLLFSRVPWPSIEKITLTKESATSVRLLQWLMEKKNCHPAYCHSNQPSFDNSSAFLSIGDKALQCRPGTGWQAWDLAQCWHQETGLPFVFAVFAVRKDLSAAKRTLCASFFQELKTSYLWSQQNILELAQYARKKLSLPLDRIMSYFQKLHYFFDAQDMDALKLFDEKVQSKASIQFF